VTGSKMDRRLLALAPMEGVTDHVYRALMTEGAGGRAVAFCVTEFVRVTDRPVPVSVLLRDCSELETGGRTPSGVPVVLQLLGGDAQPLAETARTAAALGAFGIDLNFGCPAKLVNKHDGGACLLKTPSRIKDIVSRVRDAVPPDRTVSAKIRLGWESHDEVVPLAQAAAEGGASWLTIHGRTKGEMYGPPADWIAIGKARAAVGIPVIANGDLNTEAALDVCATESGCTRFMLGRGPMGRPSLVGVGSGASDVARVQAVLLRYADVLLTRGYPAHRTVARVKQWLSLASQANPEVRAVFERVKRLQTTEEVLCALDERSGARATAGDASSGAPMSC
jgi:tRNA-dihydrouridine synthase C